MRPADFPAVDDRAVEPESGTEMIDGEARRVSPAEPPHADEQCNIAYVIRSEVAPGYAASTELLTRVDTDSDFATDACIRKLGRDPATGSRYLEELSFEVKHTQSNADITARARQLVRRGVRRVFAIHVKEGEGGTLHAGPVQEWLASEDGWLELHPDFEIEDRCLRQPVKVQALLSATEADNQVARALLAMDNAVIAADRRKALDAQKDELSEAHARALHAQKQALIDEHARALHAQGEEHARALHAQGEEHARALRAYARRAVLDVCDLLDIEVTAERRAP